MPEMMGQAHWEWIEHARETYGPVMKFHSYFGVRQPFVQQYGGSLCLTSEMQVRWLHVYDTKALHSIFIKDQESFYRGEHSRA